MEVISVINWKHNINHKSKPPLQYNFIVLVAKV